jgi:tetratricopeptide (TPR) repeat protein
LQLREEVGDKRGIAECYNNIGFLAHQEGNFISAEGYYKKSLKIREETGDKRGIAECYKNMGYNFLDEKNYESALKISLKSLAMSKELGFPDYIKNAASALSKIYKAKGDYKNALENYELFIVMRDSMSNQETKKAAIKNQLKYEYEKRAAADSVKNAEEQKVKDAQLTAQTAQIKQEKFQRYALLIGLVMVLAGLGFVINRFRITQRQKKIIEKQKTAVDEAFEKLHEKNKEILDSIHYARRIQRALLPTEKYIKRNLSKGI